MSIRNYKGQTVSEKDLVSFEKMMKDSLLGHAAETERIGEFVFVDDSRACDTLVQNYRTAAEKVGKTLKSMAAGKKSISVEEAFQKVYSDVYEQTKKDCKGFPEKQVKDLFAMVVQSTGDDSQAKYYDKDYKRAVNDEATIIKYSKEFGLVTNVPDPKEAEALADYNPNSDRVVGLAEGRMGNSGTYKYAKPGEDGQLGEAEKAHFAFNTAAEQARILSSQLMNKEQVTFSDLYDAFSVLNETLRMGDDAGGKIRGKQVAVGHSSSPESIQGIGSAKCPAAMYNTLNDIADYMNTIKKTGSRNLQKLQAVQLAAYAYQMTLSEHLFGDANGRSCRLLSDVILQSFGLPPHTPSPEEASLGHTLDGKPMDFLKGMEVFLGGVQKSSEQVLAQRKAAPAAEAAKEPVKAPAKAPAEKAPAKAVDPALTAARLAVEEIDGEFVQGAKAARAQVKAAKSAFKNSVEYNQLDLIAEDIAALTESIYDAKQKGRTEINLNSLPSSAKKLAAGVLQNQLPKDGVVDFDTAGKVMVEFRKACTQAAQQYERYKMKDHTLDPKSEPEKKPLNKDDIRKLNVVRQLMQKPPLPAAPQKAPQVQKTSAPQK